MLNKYYFIAAIHLQSANSKKLRGEMNKNRKTFIGSLNPLPKHKIYLNVNHLDNGLYTLKIMYKNKIIKKTTFNKK